MLRRESREDEHGAPTPEVDELDLIADDVLNGNPEHLITWEELNRRELEKLASKMNK